MNRFTVYHQSINGRDGDSGFNNLADAEREFDHQCEQRHVAMVELIDNADPDNPETIRSWNVREEAQAE